MHYLWQHGLCIRIIPTGHAQKFSVLDFTAPKSFDLPWSLAFEYLPLTRNFTRLGAHIKLSSLTVGASSACVSLDEIYFPHRRPAYGVPPLPRAGECRQCGLRPYATTQPNDIQIVVWNSAVSATILRRDADATAYGALKDWIDTLSSSVSGGTDFGAAVSQAGAFLNGSGGKRRILIFVTDGVLATEIALETGMPVRAVLPMPRRLYEADFTGAAREDFLRLADDDRVILQELPLPAGKTDADFLDESPRDELYARLMDYLVRRSNVLIALWDGDVTGFTGGSSDVVVRYLSSTRSQSAKARPYEAIADAELAEDRSDLAIWIETPRRSGEVAQNKVQTRYLVQAGTAGLMCQLPDIPDFVFERWTGFNDYAREYNSETGAHLPAYPISVPADLEISEIAASIDMDFVRADQLALARSPRNAAHDNTFSIRPRRRDAVSVLRFHSGPALPLAVVSCCSTRKTKSVFTSATGTLPIIGFAYVPSVLRHCWRCFGFLKPPSSTSTFASI
jgi:hypothetical protein